jgi:hypothetical protein
MENSTEDTVLTKEDKEKIIKDVWKDEKNGFGSIKDTYKQANKINSQITIKDVKTWLDKQTVRQRQYVNPRGFNSWVSKGPLFEIEVDLIDMSSKKPELNQGYKMAMTAIDNFTKFAAATPMLGKTGPDVLKALKIIFEKIGTPKQIYADREGGLNSTEMQKFLNSKNVKLVTTMFAQGVERFNRTLKTRTVLKMRAMGTEGTFLWSEQLQDNVNKYNNSEHRTIKMTPNEAKKKGNTQLVHFNIFDKAQRKDKYPKIEVGDLIRHKLKKLTFYKGYEPKWSEKVFKVLMIKGNDYMINNPNNNRLYMRSELQKVTSE